MPNIHVYLHDPKQVPALFRPRIGSSTSTTDADDDGKWVTISGAHVHIGKGGKIDKGPAELTGKTEMGAHAHHHMQRAANHADTAKAKRAEGNLGHAQGHEMARGHHAKAANMFGHAEREAEAGNLGEARKHHARAMEHAASAAQYEEHLKRDGSEAKPAAAEKPAAHAGLHADAGEDVKGSEKHEAEHKRLLKEYDKSKSNWERNAVNNLIAKNADEGSKAKAQTAHHKALALSQNAKQTGAAEHHKDARAAIDAAIAQHQRAGGDGVKAKIKELEQMRKPHHAAAEKADKLDAKEAAKNQPLPKGYEAAHDHAVKASHKAWNGDGKLQDHHDAVKALKHAQNEHREAAKTAVSHGDSEAVKHHLGKVAALRKQEQQHATHIAEHTGPNQPSASKAAPRRSGSSNQHGAGSALAKIAERQLKKTAEEAADQDPKHRK